MFVLFQNLKGGGGDVSHDWTMFELMTVSSYMCVVQHRVSEVTCV